MKKALHLIVFIIISISCNNAIDKLNKDDKKGMFFVEADNEGMNQAIATAKLTLAKFDSAFSRNDSSLSAFAVKKRYNTPNGGGEHMWIAVLRIENGRYKGFVNNDAEETTEVKYGDTVLVSPSEITDWMYLENKTLRGGYTIREMRRHLTAVEKARSDSATGIKIDD